MEEKNRFKKLTLFKKKNKELEKVRKKILFNKKPDFL